MSRFTALPFKQMTTDNGLTVRLLSEVDVDAVFRIHCSILAEAKAGEVYRASDRKHFERHINKDGITMGAFCPQNGLIAFAILRFPELAPDNLGLDLQIADTKLMSVAHLEECAVHLSHRGRGLQRLLIRERIHLAKRLGAEVMAVTVAPSNVFSLKNAIESGFAVKVVAMKYGGHARFVLFKYLKGAASQRNIACFRESVPLENLVGIEEVLRQGLCGVGIVAGKNISSRRLLFADVAMD
jgi:GNAT superfamily N-acetyltransferase